MSESTSRSTNRSDETTAKLHQSLQKLIGLHRQLLESVRLERDALLSADLKIVQDSTFAKEALVESIRQAEVERMRIVADFAFAWKKPVSELSLSNIIIGIQGDNLKAADQLRSSQNALQVLVSRIVDQNSNNRKICERSLTHFNAMKKNVLGEGSPKSDVYSQQGQRVNGPAQSRLLSREI